MDKSKLVEIAQFPFNNNSAVLQSILEDEGIEFFISNENFTSVYPGIMVDGGAGLIVREEDVAKVVEIVKESGFEEFLKEEFNK